MDDISMLGLCRLGVIGLGTIGSKLTVYLASKKVKVIAYCRNNIDNHRMEIKKIAGRFCASFDISDYIKVTNQIEDICDLDLIIDSTSEDYESKGQIYHIVKTLGNQDCVIATTTSSLDLLRLEHLYKHGQLFGLHLFNPPDKMNLIELTILKESAMTRGMVEKLKRILDDKQFVELPIVQGYVVNRLLFVYLNAAYNYHIETGIEFGKIDICMKLGTNMPMGPFLLSDYIGLDVCLQILQEFYHAFKSDVYRPSSLLVNAVRDGCFGKKVAKGFYVY